MNVRNTDSVLRITIGTNVFTLDELRGREITLLLKHAGKAYFNKKILLNDLQNAIQISKTGIPAGISSITLLDDSGRPQCERLFYNQPTETLAISISSDKAVYVSKGKVTLNIKTTDQNMQPVKANISLAAVDALIPQNNMSIRDYFNFTSEIKGKVENAYRYVDASNPRAKQEPDLLLLTQGWRDYTWKQVADSALRITHALEQGITVSGRVREISKNKAISGANITLKAAKAKGSLLYSAATDSAGKYYFDGLQLYGEQLLVLSSRNNRAERLGWISMDSLYVAALPVYQTRINTESDSTDKKILAGRILEKSRLKRFGLSDTVQLKELTIKASKYVRLFDQTVVSFGYKDIVLPVTPKDYDLKNLGHFIGLYYTFPYIKKGIDERLIINNKELPFTGDPRDREIRGMYFNQYYSMPINLVEKVVIKHYLGMDPNNGSTTDVFIIYLTVKPEALVPQEHDKLTTYIKGYYEARTFYTPKYESNSTKTDLRSTIHWEPNIITNEKGEATITYYNADQKSKVRIIAEGVSETGIPVTGTASYEVK